MYAVSCIRRKASGQQYPAISQPVPGKEHFLIPVVPVLGCIYDELSITAVTDFTDQHVHHWIPGFFLAFQPNKDVIKGHFLTNVVLKALPAGLTDVLAVAAMAVFGQTFGLGETDISTAGTMLLAIVGFMILFKICEPFNWLRGCVWVGSVIGLLGCSIFLPKLFAITGMSTKCIMLFVVFSIATSHCSGI